MGYAVGYALLVARHREADKGVGGGHEATLEQSGQDYENDKLGDRPGPYRRQVEQRGTQAGPYQDILQRHACAQAARRHRRDGGQSTNEDEGNP